MNFKSNKAGVAPKSGLQIDAPRAKDGIRTECAPETTILGAECNGGRDRNVWECRMPPPLSMISEV